MKRLSGWDAVLLYSETPTVHMHTLKLAVIDVSELKGRQFGIDEFRQVIARPALQARSVLLSARRHPVQVPPPDVAGELRGRPRTTTSGRTASTAPAAAANSTRRSAGSPAPRWTAASRCGRCTSSRVWPTAGSRCSARSTTRWPTASRRRTCWRAGWTCSRVRRPIVTRTQRIPPPTKRRTGAHGVRRPHAPDRPAARGDALHRAGHAAGCARARASCRRS